MERDCIVLMRSAFNCRAPGAETLSAEQIVVETGEGYRVARLFSEFSMVENVSMFRGSIFDIPRSSHVPYKAKYNKNKLI